VLVEADPVENKESPRPFMLPKAAGDGALSLDDAALFPGAKGEDSAAAGLLFSCVAGGLGPESFAKGFFGACLGIGGSSADDGVDFFVAFFSEGVEDGICLFLPVENGFVGALFDKGGKAAVEPLFSSPSFNRLLPFEVGKGAALFFLMSMAAFNFSGVVPKLAKVSREALDNVVCFRSRGASNDS